MKLKIYDWWTCTCIWHSFWITIHKNWFQSKLMKSSLFSRFGRACRVPAGAAAASATAFMLGEVGTKNTSRRFASNASASAAETLLQNTSKTTTRKSATVASSSAGINSNKAGGNSMLQWYEKHLKANPVRTKMVTGGILWVSQCSLHLLIFLHRVNSYTNISSWLKGLFSFREPET